MTVDLAVWSLVLSAVGGIIATLTFVGITYIRQVWMDRRMFERLAGAYQGYSYVKDGTKVNWGEQVSTAQLTYLGKNALKIELEHDSTRPEGPHKWEGKILLNREYDGLVGKIAWRYTTFAVDERRVGFKDCIINEGEDEIEIYLIGDKLEGYGMEILRRKLPGQTHDRMDTLPVETPTRSA